MQAKHKLIAGVVAVAIVGLFIYSQVNKEAHALERRSESVGKPVNCSIEKVNGKRWGVCRLKHNDAPDSAWLKRGGVWVAANSEAREVVNGVQMTSGLSNLPDVEVDYLNSPTMPDDLFEK
ncbi:hypothetical protein [Pseudomonas viridiflava]|uniref:hypothetical protein n=1 Tax=Pseudomonas viridiflava TaxID=33069 RepID=UPI000F01EB46|nr:hypothetical protein [Pseudomonas viridiflava]